MMIDVDRDHEEIRDAVMRLCAPFDDAYWQRLDREMAYPDAFVAALSEAGFLGALIPEEHGGSGLSLRAATVILETIHAAGCNAAACHAQMYIMGTILRHGSAAQKVNYLPKIATGALRLQAFGVTEPTSGTDTAALRTRAERTADGWLVNGQKVWTSRAKQSDLMLLLARTTPIERVQRRTDGLSTFLVDLREAVGRGVEIRPIEAMINHNTNEVFIADLHLPEDALVGEEGRGFRYILDGMNAERILIASECIGDARWFLERASAYARERRVFGRPIGQNQGIQFPLARALAETEAAELMVRKAAALFDAGEPCGPEANMAKHLASEASWHAGEAAMQTHGGYAFATDYAIERKWRETRLYQIAPVSTNLILAFLAHRVLGLPKSY
ncbi:MAG: acyl-CoA/acyl-ACP dehydrogenase [Geminicoccaceae bacterium]|nr:acyl-CoA/acyl-ACP dehydrogenase [Geminicoccaceae bacterium]